MNEERLLRLADFLENNVAKMPKHKFNLDFWSVDNRLMLLILQEAENIEIWEEDINSLYRLIQHDNNLVDSQAYEPITGDKLGRYQMMDCKTVACACGWATTIPEFFEAGFGLDRYGDIMYHNEETGRTEHSSAAVRAFFGLGMYETDALFLSTWYEENKCIKKPTPEDVADKIRSLVGHGPFRSDSEAIGWNSRWMKENGYA